MTDGTSSELMAGLCYQSLPRTATGKPRRFECWQTALAAQIEGFDFARTQHGYLNTSGTGKQHGKKADEGTHARVYDFVSQYPDTARAMLLSLVVVASDEHEAGAVAMYAGLLADFDTWGGSPDPFGEEPSEPAPAPLPDNLTVTDWIREDGRRYVSIARTNRKGYVKRFAVPVECVRAVADAMCSV